MAGCDHSLADKPPNVELVDGSHARHLGHQPRLQVQQVDVRGDGVEEDEGGVPEERPGAHQDDDHDDQGEDGVQVVLVLPLCEHDDQGGDAHHHAAQGVRQHVEEHPGDVHAVAAGGVAVAVPVTLGLLGCVAVAVAIICLVVLAVAVLCRVSVTVSVAVLLSVAVAVSTICRLGFVLTSMAVAVAHVTKQQHTDLERVGILPHIYLK